MRIVRQSDGSLDLIFDKDGTLLSKGKIECDVDLTTARKHEGFAKCVADRIAIEKTEICLIQEKIRLCAHLASACTANRAANDDLKVGDVVSGECSGLLRSIYGREGCLCAKVFTYHGRTLDCDFSEIRPATQSEAVAIAEKALSTKQHLHRCEALHSNFLAQLSKISF